MSTKKFITPILAIVLLGLIAYGITSVINVMADLETHKVKLKNTEDELKKNNQKLEAAEKDNKGDQEKIKQLEDEKKNLESELQAKKDEEVRLVSVQQLKQSMAASAMKQVSATSYEIATTYTGNGMWCTDYVHSKRPDIPIYGNAGYNWISSAQASGRATGTVAQAGAIAVMAGHVAYVESVNGDGSYTVSEMGWNYVPGNFNERTVSAGAFGGFIY